MKSAAKQNILSSMWMRHRPLQHLKRKRLSPRIRAIQESKIINSIAASDVILLVIVPSDVRNEIGNMECIVLCANDLHFLQKQNESSANVNNWFYLHLQMK